MAIDKTLQRARFEAEMAEQWNRRKGVTPFTFAVMTINGKFSRYMDPDTDNAWIGFQLGEGTAVARAPLTTICPNHRFGLLDDGMGELARVPAAAWSAAHYHAHSGDVH